MYRSASLFRSFELNQGDANACVQKAKLGEVSKVCALYEQEGIVNNESFLQNVSSCAICHVAACVVAVHCIGAHANQPPPLKQCDGEPSATDFLICCFCVSSSWRCGFGRCLLPWAARGLLRFLVGMDSSAFVTACLLSLPRSSVPNMFFGGVMRLRFHRV